MAAQNAAASDQTVFRARRDYRLSLALVTTGIVMVVAVAAFGLWANSTGNNPTSFDSGLAVGLINIAGFMLILLAGTVALYHRSFLRQIGNA